MKILSNPFVRTVVIALALVSMMRAGCVQALAAPSESVLWSFGGTGDGYVPFAGLINLRGSLYGTTVDGGAHGLGVVFKLTPPARGQTQWSESVLWSFSGIGGDGLDPSASLINLRGALYGTTLEGGIDLGGTVFKLVP
jgi:uncharacterized repeat protein (TIGR03803 family)